MITTGSNHNGIDPPRDILTSNLNCDCDRGVFSISITKNFGNIFYTAIFAGILGGIAVFGTVAAFTYKSRKKQTKLVSNTNRNNSRAVTEREILIKYFVMMFAIGAGMVHLAVYSDHGSLRIQYSIFLLAARQQLNLHTVLYMYL